MEAVFSTILEDEQILRIAEGTIQATVNTFQDDLHKLPKRLFRHWILTAEFTGFVDFRRGRS
jgi:hypothetical protein